MKKTMKKLNSFLLKGKANVEVALNDNKGEGYIDTIVKMAIAVVVGALLLTILLAVIGKDADSGVMGTLNKALKGLFDAKAA